MYSQTKCDIRYINSRRRRQSAQYSKTNQIFSTHLNWERQSGGLRTRERARTTGLQT